MVRLVHFDAIAKRLRQYSAPIEFVRVHHSPNSSFPNGIPTIIAPKSCVHCRSREAEADMGVAFDGDFDRCFLFDEKGHFVPGEYIVGLLASIF